jgi:hypothetical protein
MIFTHHAMIPQTRPHPKPRLALPFVSRVNSPEVFLSAIIPACVCSSYFALKIVLFLTTSVASIESYRSRACCRMAVSVKRLYESQFIVEWGGRRVCTVKYEYKLQGLDGNDYSFFQDALLAFTYENGEGIRTSKRNITRDLLTC